MLPLDKEICIGKRKPTTVQKHRGKINLKVFSEVSHDHLNEDVFWGWGLWYLQNLKAHCPGPLQVSGSDITVKFFLATPPMAQVDKGLTQTITSEGINLNLGG
jgi:hypothetical protein